MEPNPWIPVAVALIAAIPSIIISIATLVSVIKGNARTETKMTDLTDAVNGRMTNMIEAVKQSSKVEGKLETLENIAAKTPATPTILIGDRRKKATVEQVD